MMKLRRKKYDTFLADDSGGGGAAGGGEEEEVPDKNEAKVRRGRTRSGSVGREEAPAIVPPAADKEKDHKDHKEKDDKEKNHKEHKEKEKKHKEHKDPEKEKEAKHARKLLEKRMKGILKEPGNKVCSECRSKKPKWIALLQAPIDAERQQLGVLCCSDCEAYHEALGPELCILKSLKVPEEWTEEDITTLEKSGNQVVNAIYQSALEGKHTDKHIGMLASKAFVESKYKHCQYFSEGAFHEQMELRAKLLAEQNALNGHEEEEAEPTTVDLVKQALQRQKKEAVPIEDKNAIRELAEEGTDRSVLEAMFSAETVTKVLGKGKDPDIGVHKRPSLIRATSNTNLMGEPIASGRRPIRRGSLTGQVNRRDRSPTRGARGGQPQLRRAMTQEEVEPSGAPARPARGTNPRRTMSHDGLPPGRGAPPRAGGRRPTLAKREASFRNRPSLKEASAGSKSFRHRPTQSNSSDGSHRHHHKGPSPPPERERGSRRPTMARRGASVRNLNSPADRHPKAAPNSADTPQHGWKRTPNKKIPQEEDVEDNTTGWSRTPAKNTKLLNHVADDSQHNNHHNKRRGSSNKKSKEGHMKDHSEISEAKSPTSAQRRRSSTTKSLQGALTEMDQSGDNGVPQYGWNRTNDKLQGMLDQSEAISLGASSRRSAGSKEHLKKAVPKLLPNSSDIPKHSGRRQSKNLGPDHVEKTVPKLLPPSSDIPKHSARRPSKMLENLDLFPDAKKRSSNDDDTATTDHSGSISKATSKKSKDGDNSPGRHKRIPSSSNHSGSSHPRRSGSDDGSTASGHHNKRSAPGDRSGDHRRALGDHSASGQPRRKGGSSDKLKKRGHHDRERSPGARVSGKNPSGHSRGTGSPKPKKIVEEATIDEEVVELVASGSVDSGEIAKDISQNPDDSSEGGGNESNSHLDGLDDDSDFDVDVDSDVELSEDDDISFAESGSSGDPKIDDDDTENDDNEQFNKDATSQSHHRRAIASDLKGHEVKIQDDGSSTRVQSTGQDTKVRLDMGAALKKFIPDEE